MNSAEHVPATPQTNVAFLLALQQNEIGVKQKNNPIINLQRNSKFAYQQRLLARDQRYDL